MMRFFSIVNRQDHARERANIAQSGRLWVQSSPPGGCAGFGSAPPKVLNRAKPGDLAAWFQPNGALVPVDGLHTKVETFSLGQGYIST
jgi:hypothetical protein